MGTFIPNFEYVPAVIIFLKVNNENTWTNVRNFFKVNKKYQNNLNFVKKFQVKYCIESSQSLHWNQSIDLQDKWMDWLLYDEYLNC